MIFENMLLDTVYYTYHITICLNVYLSYKGIHHTVHHSTDYNTFDYCNS